MNRPIVSQSIFEKAKLLHEKEDFAGSTKLLQGVVDVGDESVDGVSSTEVFALIGWNILALRDFMALSEWENELVILDIHEQPDFELIRVWALGIQGKTQEAIFKSNKFLEMNGAAIHNLHPDFLLARGRCYAQEGHMKKPIQDCEISYSIFMVLNRRIEAGKAANILGIQYLELSNYPKAIEWYSKASAIFEELNLRKKKSLLDLNVGLVHYKTGNFPKSLQLLKESLKIGVEGNWINRQSFANIALGNVYRMTRDFSFALKHLSEGLAQVQSLSMTREEAIALGFIGDVHREQGQFTKAQEYYKKTLDIISPLAPQGDIVAETHRRIGECLVLKGEFISAQPHLKKALKMTRLQGDRFEEAVTLRVMAESSSASGNPVTALEYIMASRAILKDIGANYELAITNFRHAQILLAGKDDNTLNVPVIVQLNQAWHSAIESLSLFSNMKISWWTSQVRTLVKQTTSLITQQQQIDRDIAAARIARDGKDYNPKSTIIHNSESMNVLLELCDLYAPDDVPVLISGETGTGKELLARRVHDLSKRPGKLVTVNCASISATLFEREFFGHVKGAFSGADKDSIGFAEQAHRGTLFLDEVGELPMELQPKLLRLLQNGTFHAVGDPSDRSVDIRLVAATNVDLYAAVQNKTFREDLYYRLEVLTLAIAPLKERRDDIIPLMEHFLSRVAGHTVTIGEYLNTTSEKFVLEYSWPGNVREIISVCRKLHLQITKLSTVKVDLGRGTDACILTGPGYLEMKAEAGGRSGSLDDPKQRLMSALEKSNGNRAEAARLLSVGRSTLYRQIKEFGV